MPRLGKKTLYLDLDALARIQASLSKFPGKPSLSSFLNEQLPTMADSLERMVGFLTDSSFDVDAIKVGLNAVADEQLELLVAAKKMIRDVPPKDSVIDVPASKPKRQKKSA